MTKKEYELGRKEGRGIIRRQEVHLSQMKDVKFFYEASKANEDRSDFDRGMAEVLGPFLKLNEVE